MKNFRDASLRDRFQKGPNAWRELFEDLASSLPSLPGTLAKKGLFIASLFWRRRRSAWISSSSDSWWEVAPHGLRAHWSSWALQDLGLCSSAAKASLTNQPTKTTTTTTTTRTPSKTLYLWVEQKFIFVSWAKGHFEGFLSVSLWVCNEQSWLKVFLWWRHHVFWPKFLQKFNQIAMFWFWGPRLVFTLSYFKTDHQPPSLCISCLFPTICAYSRSPRKSKALPKQYGMVRYGQYSLHSSTSQK